MGRKRKTVPKSMEKRLKSVKRKSVADEDNLEGDVDDIYDNVDVYHNAQDKLLLDKTSRENNYNSDEDVLGFSSDESDIGGEEDDMASDLADEEGDFPHTKAWGKNKRVFFSTDDVDEEKDDEGSDVAAADLEEQEARDIQKKLAEQLDEDDYGLELFSLHPTKKEEAGEERSSKVQVDLTKVSKQEQLHLLQEESPELLPLINEFKSRWQELTEKILPLDRLVKAGNIPPGDGAKYVTTKRRLLLIYCVNLAYYLVLKSRRAPISHHPVMKRVAQFGKLLRTLEQCDECMESEVCAVLEMVKNGEEVRPKPAAQLTKGSRKRPQKMLRILSGAGKETQDVEEDLVTQLADRDKRMKDKEVEERDKEGENKRPRTSALDPFESRKKQKAMKQEECRNEEDTEMVEGSKRGITYDIAKNKGLTPYRKKELKNPRVKHRAKFRKATIRRKGQVRQHRLELEKYGGELSGIKAGLTRSIKIK